MEVTFSTIRNIALGVVGFIVLALAGCSSFYTVEQGERGIHLRTGALVGVQQPGLKLKVPFIDDVRHISLRESSIKWQLDGSADSRMNSYSKDQQPAEIAVTLTWTIPGDDKTVADVFTTYGSRDRLADNVIVPKTVEALKNVFGNYDAVSVIQQRERFNNEVAAAVRELLVGYPVKVSAIQVQDIEFSKAYEDAVEARMMAQVEVQKKEQEKQTVQIQADMVVINAEAKAKQVRLAGDAEAAAIRAKSDALASSPKLVELTLAEAWDGVLPTTMVPGGAVPFINVK